MVKNIVFTYITPFYPQYGGIARVTHSLTIEFLRRGYRVFYLIYNCTSKTNFEFDYPAPLTYLPSKELLSQENISFYHEFLKENKIDVIINQSGNFDDSKLWVNTGDENIKVISVLHSNPWVAYKHLWSSDILPLKNNSFKEYIKRLARVILYPYIKHKYKESRIKQFQFLLPHTDIVCTLSPNYFKAISEICPGYENKYYAIPNPNSFPEEELDINLNIKKKQLLFVGLFGSPKREDRLIYIWSKLYKEFRDWELIIVGTGSDARVKYIKHLASEIPNIHFKGFTNPLPYYKDARIFCLTSNYEGWPMVIPEAMQCGVVPIAFNSFAAATDIIQDNINGKLIKPFSLKLYTKTLRDLMSNENRLRQMAEHAKKYIDRFSIQNIADQWEDLFHIIK